MSFIFKQDLFPNLTFENGIFVIRTQSGEEIKYNNIKIDSDYDDKHYCNVTINLTVGKEYEINLDEKSNS